MLDDDHHQRVIPSNSPQSLNHHPHGPHGSIKMVHVHRNSQKAKLCDARVSSLKTAPPGRFSTDFRILPQPSDSPTAFGEMGNPMEIPQRNVVTGCWEDHQMEVEKWDCLQMGSHAKITIFNR